MSHSFILARMPHRIDFRGMLRISAYSKAPIELGFDRSQASSRRLNNSISGFVGYAENAIGQILEHRAGVYDPYIAVMPIGLGEEIAITLCSIESDGWTYAISNTAVPRTFTLDAEFYAGQGTRPLRYLTARPNGWDCPE